MKQQVVKTVEEREKTRELVKVSVSGWLGTALEYIDFQLYGLAAALVFDTLFFPKISPAAGLIASMATYGVGYFARLVGAWFFGRMGDRIGRKTTLVMTIGLMGGGSTLIGMLPTYAQIGIWAPVLLLILRLIQGFGAGAEISGATVLLTEYAPSKHRGLLSSLVALGTNSGTLMASGIWLALVAVLPQQQLIAWGWRIPFLASLLIALFAIWIRRHINETPVFLNRPDVVNGVAMSAKELKTAVASVGDGKMDADKVEIFEEAMKQRRGRSFLVAFGLRFGQAGNSGIVQTFLVGYLVTTLLVSKSVPSSALVWGSLLGFVTVPIVGWLGDRFGRRPMYMVFTVLTIVIVWPVMLMITSHTTWMIVAGMIILLNMGVLSLFSLENVTMSELFGSRNRYTQLALSKEFAGVLATGLGPFIASVLCAWAGTWWPIVVMIMIFSVVTLTSSIVSPEVAGRDMEDMKDAV